MQMLLTGMNLSLEVTNGLKSYLPKGNILFGMTPSDRWYWHRNKATN